MTHRALRTTVGSVVSLTRAVSSMLGKFGLAPASRGPIRVTTPGPEPAEDDPDNFGPLRVLPEEEH